MAKNTRPKSGGTDVAVVLPGVLVLIAVALALASFLYNERWRHFNEQYVLAAVEQQTLVPQILSSARGAARGDETDFERLQTETETFEQRLEELKVGNPVAGVPASPQEVDELLGTVETGWMEMREVTDQLLSSRNAITGVSELTEAVRAPLPELTETVEEVAELMAGKEGTSPSAVLVAAQQAVLLERIGNGLDKVLPGGTAGVEALDHARTAASDFSRNLDELLQDDPQIRALLEKIEAPYGAVRDNLDKLNALMPEVTPSSNEVQRMAPAAAKLSDDLKALVHAYRQIPGRMRIAGVPLGMTTAIAFGALAALLLVVLFLRLRTWARRKEAEAKETGEVNQQSILRLLDEMGDLADGDLTVEATVTEDITGAIADSINYAVDALRSLVTTINATSEKVASSAQDTRKTTLELAEASDAQTQQIANATGAIKALTQAIDEVANNATESAEVASRSVEVAGRGAQTVRDTISGMDSIREQIQETSKRIKRLGESSQEIGEIVELIDDIADQTNILALNAAMQAAQAGEAGRGFAVVADEVQGLAERSSNATKQIEALVRTIQADTNEAVSSMETSTAGVVEGATLAENAGDALREIENVSNYIADMTRRIADSAQGQSREAGKINSTVAAIQEITAHNAEGTRGTADSVEALAELAVELQQSVAGFRLP